jgi:hypothetical protein
LAAREHNKRRLLDMKYSSSKAANLYAKGRGNGKPFRGSMFLWGHGDYTYEIERLVSIDGKTKSEIFKSSYGGAMHRFEQLVDDVTIIGKGLE